MGKALFCLVVYVCLIAEVCTASPLTPKSFYADPEPHVWKDGKIYIYGSHDVGDGKYCSDNYHFISSYDLIHWTDPGVSFTISNMPAGSGSRLYACDAAFKDGKYYLYVSTDNRTLGVAISDSPTGPFTNARKVEGLPDHPGIDPGVFLDDDGQTYIYWGQGDSVRAAKLKANMTEVDLDTIMQPLSVAEHHFHEGSAMVKRNGIYYYVYADESREKRPTCLGYATGPTPLGPFTYRGVIIDNKGSDPDVWNNHGRIVEFKDQWYVFYHRATHGDRHLRQTHAEPITFTADGLIPEVQMTSHGVRPPLDVTRRTLASAACLLSGKARVEGCTGGDLCLGQINQGDTAIYRGVRFSGHPKQFSGRCFVEGASGTLEVRLDNAKSDPVAVLLLPATDRTATWQTLSVPLRFAVPFTGVHNIYLSFKNARPMSLAWFKFDL